MKLINLFEEEHLENLAKILSGNKTYMFDGKKRTIHTFNDLRRYLARHNFKIKFVGSGLFSKGFLIESTNEKYILKISKNNGYYRNDGWFNFARYAKNKQHNPLFPKILYTGEILTSYLNQTVGIGLVEYLNIPNNTEKLANKIRKIFYYIIQKEFNVTTIDPDVFKMMTEKEDEMFNYLKANNITLEDAVEFCEVIIECFNEFKVLDIKSQNIGFRKNGQIVFFDPVAFN